MSESIRRSLTQDWLTVALQLSPSDAETAAMVSDLRAVLTPQGVAQVLGVRPVRIVRWCRGYMLPGKPIRRIIYWAWCDICRPGQCVTVFDRSTWGRFTKLGGPEHAGSKPLRRNSRLAY